MRRITPSTVTLMVVGAFGILAAAYIVKNSFGSDEAPAAESIRVPVPIADLAPDTMLTEQHLADRLLQEDQLPPGTIFNRAALVGRRVRTPLPAAMPIQANSLYPPGDAPPIAARVPADHVAVTIDVDSRTHAVGGLLRAGDSVDVLLTVTGSNDPRLRGGLTMTLLRGIQVLAVNQNISQTLDPPSDDRLARSTTNVTVAVTPSEANVLVLARERGEITLVLNRAVGASPATGETPVPPGETLVPPTATLEEILGLEPIVTEQPIVAEIYRAGRGDRVEFLGGTRVETAITPNVSAAAPASTSAAPGGAAVPSAAPADAPQDE